MASRTDVQELPRVTSRWAACSLGAPCAPHLLPQMPLPDTYGSWLGCVATPIFRTCSSGLQKNPAHSTAWERQTGNHTSKGLMLHKAESLLGLDIKHQYFPRLKCFHSNQ